MRKIVLLFVLMAFVCADEVQQEGSEIILEISITDYIKIINCLLAQESLMKDVTELIEMIKTQDFTKLIELAIRLYTAVTIERSLPLVNLGLSGRYAYADPVPHLTGVGSLLKNAFQACFSLDPIESLTWLPPFII